MEAPKSKPQNSHNRASAEYNKRLRLKVLHILGNKCANPAGYQLLCANCNWMKRAENREYGGQPTRIGKPYSPINAARVLGIGIQEVYHLVRGHKLKATKVSNRWLIDPSSVASRRALQSIVKKLRGADGNK